MLNLTKFSWFIPKISGQFPTGRAYHKANVIGKYMVISFGKYHAPIYTKDLIYLNQLFNKLIIIFNRTRL